MPLHKMRAVPGLRDGTPIEETIMRCPADGETLMMTERAGVEINYCPKCRGVWLDRGQLDKIIERFGQVDAPSAGDRRGDRRDDHHEDRDRRPHGGKRKRGRVLKELFDF